MKLTVPERLMERALLKGEYVDMGKSELKRIAKIIARRRKKAVLTIRMNQQDLESIKKKAKQYNIPYQTFISEILHRIAA